MPLRAAATTRGENKIRPYGAKRTVKRQVAELISHKQAEIGP